MLSKAGAKGFTEMVKAPTVVTGAAGGLRPSRPVWPARRPR